ncbi:MAG: 30S ribosomal protein S18 [candidate division WOR-3 bacterium]
MIRKRKHCFFCERKEQVITYNNPVLRNFISERGKILPAQYTGTCPRHQRRLKKAIKLARNLAILSYVKR